MTSAGFFCVTFFYGLNSVQQLFLNWPALPGGYLLSTQVPEAWSLPSVDIPQSWVMEHTKIKFQSKVANAIVAWRNKERFLDAGTLERGRKCLCRKCYCSLHSSVISLPRALGQTLPSARFMLECFRIIRTSPLCSFKLKPGTERACGGSWLIPGHSALPGTGPI